MGSRARGDRQDDAAAQLGGQRDASVLHTRARSASCFARTCGRCHRLLAVRAVGERADARTRAACADAYGRVGVLDRWTVVAVQLVVAPPLACAVGALDRWT